MPNETGTVSERLLTTDLDEEVGRVVEELEELERRGVVVLDDDGGFAVRGGNAVVVALKYQAQSLLGPDKVEKPFGIPFLPCVGQPLAQHYARRAITGLPGARRLASSPAFAASSSSSSARLRAALDTRPFAGLDVDVMFIDVRAHERMVELVLNPELASVIVVDFTLAAGERQLDSIEIWEVPADAGSHEVNQCLSDALEGWQQLALAAGVRWRGSHAVLFNQGDAACALIQLCQSVSDMAVPRAWGDWRAAEDGTMPDRVVAIAETTVRALKAHRVPDWERGWELSQALSRLGFLLSLYDDRLDEARVNLEHAKERGPADGWVTEWNLANLAARGGELAEALTTLDRIGDEIHRAKPAHMLFFVPGRAAISSIVALDEASAPAVFALQRALFVYLLNGGSIDAVRAAIESCTLADAAAVEVADWVRQSILSTLPGFGAA